MDLPILIFTHQNKKTPCTNSIFSDPYVFAELGFSQVFITHQREEALKFVDESKIICLHSPEFRDPSAFIEFSRFLREQEKHYHKPIIAIISRLSFLEDLRANGIDLVLEDSIEKQVLRENIQNMVSAKKNRTNLKYIQPFLEALKNIFKQKSIACTYSKPLYVYDIFHKWGTISAIISFSAQSQGSLLLSMDEDSARNLLPSLFGISQFSQLLLQDGVGELANQIVGNARKGLKTLGISLQFSIPNIIIGEEYGINRPNFENSIYSRITWEKGQLFLNLALKKQEEIER